MPFVVRRRFVHRWSVAFAAIVVAMFAAAAFAVASSRYGWLTRDQISGVGGILPIAALIALVYVVMNWVETGGWSWSRVEDDRCLDAAREFVQRLVDGDEAGAFELADAATFGEPQREFARWAASQVRGRTIISVSERDLSTSRGLVPAPYRTDREEPFALVAVELDASPDEVAYVPLLRLVLSEDAPHGAPARRASERLKSPRSRRCACESCEPSHGASRVDSGSRSVTAPFYVRSTG